jgi:hypothetical protein
MENQREIQIQPFWRSFASAFNERRLVQALIEPA